MHSRRPWLQPLLLGLAAVLLIGWFSPEISDSDFWWHLKTGQYIVENHRLPVPDPFAFTTASAGEAYPGEAHTRYFNLTHEWLAQTLLYGVYRVAGFGGVVAFRALVLTLCCALVGLVAWRRRGGILAAIGAAIAAGGVLSGFASDRPTLISFLLVVVTIALMDSGPLWVLPPLMLVWANLHGGFFLGWVVLGAYALEAVVLRLRGKPTPDDRKLWVVCGVSVLLSGLNPNGFRILQILTLYRKSFLQSRLLEWAAPEWWPPHWYTVLLALAALTMFWARRRVRIADWALFAAFALAAMTAYRNLPLIGVLAPILIVTYAPEWKWASRPILEWGAAATLAGALIVTITGSSYRFRVNPWKWPAGAADFVLAHHITQPIFNTYEYGGYLIWRLWPQERVFIDGRALSERVFLDWSRILYNHDESGGRSAQQLLDDYGVEAIVMNGFEYTTGAVYFLAPALADPHQTEWKLVYNDPTAMVFVRHPQPDMPVLNSLTALEHLEAECSLHLDHEPQFPACARALGEVFLKVGDTARARRWLATYVQLPHERDPDAEEALRRLLAAGR